MPVGTDNHANSFGDGRAHDAGDVGRCLGSLFADPDGGGLTLLGAIADVDIIAAGGKVVACKVTQCDVGVTRAVLSQSLDADGGIVATADIQIEAS